MQNINQISISRRSILRRNRSLPARPLVGAMGPVTTTLLLAIIIGVLALLYLTQITKTSVYGYQVSNLTQERKQLSQRSQELQVEAARLQSIANISQRRAVGSLQPEQNPQFINP
ncbi:hypothetical protein HY441_02290 [Candidatus Microgenomates bacterium]|nr:hypothetical protein [Candidatus Microgenomates bacterium]